MKKIAIGVIGALVVYSSGAFAHGGRHHHGKVMDGSGVEYARVVSVTPVTKLVRTTVPRRECWDEQVVYRERRSATPSIVGALIGGAIGNELGHHNSNKKVGAVAGALLGASVARDRQGAHHDQATHVKTEEVCKVRHETFEEEQVVEYKVRYRYHGREFITRTDTHPGERIKVKVDVSPVM